MKVLILIVIISAAIIAIYFIFRRKWKTPANEMPDSWKKTLHEYVLFYRKLNPDRKKQFEYEVMEFLANYKITGVGTSVDDLDRLLIASSGVIPIFAFPDWKYRFLEEVILYPSSFNMEFETEGGGNRRIRGMVGEGFMTGKMILSKKALRQGFMNKTDKHNTAIHEFVHLIDKEDGYIDGLPKVLVDKQFVLPWFQMIENKIEEIVKEESDIRDYAAYNNQEFFAVMAEYFFERPDLLKRKHPDLYKMLESVFT